jgi:hypothetical protein
LRFGSLADSSGGASSRSFHLELDLRTCTGRCADGPRWLRPLASTMFPSIRRLLSS